MTNSLHDAFIGVPRPGALAYAVRPKIAVNRGTNLRHPNQIAMPLPRLMRPRSACPHHQRFAIRLLAVTMALHAAGCSNPEQVPAEERRAIADSLQQLVVQAYDFSKPDVDKRILTLYPDTGRVISAGAGRVTATREALAAELAGFWQRVGRNMQGARFNVGSSYVDVITRNAALMTFTYSIPHTTPAGRLHTVQGAWTSLWRRQGGRWTIVQEHLSDTPESTAPSSAPSDSASNAMGGHGMPRHVMPPEPIPPGGGTN